MVSFTCCRLELRTLALLSGIQIELLCERKALRTTLIASIGKQCVDIYQAARTMTALSSTGIYLLKKQVWLVHGRWSGTFEAF